MKGKWRGEETIFIINLNLYFMLNLSHKKLDVYLKELDIIEKDDNHTALTGEEKILMKILSNGLW